MNLLRVGVRPVSSGPDKVMIWKLMVRSVVVSFRVVSLGLMNLILVGLGQSAQVLIWKMMVRSVVLMIHSNETA